MKITRAVMGGLAIAKAVSASGGILVAVGIVSFIIGAIAGWNLN